MPATPTYALPYPVGTDLVRDGDNAIKALAERVETLLTATDANVAALTTRMVTAETEFTYAQLSGTTPDIGGATAVTVPGWSYVPWVKQRAATRVVMEVMGSCYSLAGASCVGFGIQGQGPINWAVGRVFINPASSHTPFSAVITIAAFAAGTYNIAPYWQLISGGACRVDGNDQWSIRLREIP